MRDLESSRTRRKRLIANEPSCSLGKSNSGRNLRDHVLKIIQAPPHGILILTPCDGLLMQVRIAAAVVRRGQGHYGGSMSSYSLKAIEIQLSARRDEAAALVSEQEPPEAHARLLVESHSRRQPAEAATTRGHSGSTAKALL